MILGFFRVPLEVIRKQEARKSDVKAHAWFNLCAAQGEESCASFKTALAEVMTNDQIAGVRYIHPC